MEASYKQVYSEEDVKKVEKKLSWESKKTSAERTLAESKTNLPKQEAELSTLQKQPVATDKKLAAQATKAIAKKQADINQTRAAIPKAEKDIAEATKEIEKANKEKLDKVELKYTQPDLMYTLPGDLIIYEIVDPIKDIDPPGHIDIRTYHGFGTDAAWATIPALGTPPQGRNRYRVIGVYRKISDTLAMVRVQAYLRMVREQVAGELPASTKAKDKLTGAYKIKFGIWVNVINAVGWPETYTSEMQDRVAMYLLQWSPRDRTPHPHRTALGYQRDK